MRCQTIGWALAIGVTVLLAHLHHARAAEPAAPNIAQVLARLDDLYRSGGSVGTVELTVVKPKRSHSMQFKMWTSGETKALIVITSPEREKGTATLKVDKNLWNYMPKINRTVRIPPSMMLSSWMGSDLTNDDLVRDSSLARDFTTTLDGRSQAPDGWKLSLVAKPDLVGLWRRIEYVVSQDGTLPLCARFFDRKDRLARTIEFSEVKAFGKRRIPTRMVLVPYGDNGQPEPEQRTEMRYLEIQFDAAVPEQTFSLSALERTR